MARGRPPTGRTEIESRLIKRAWRDAAFRSLLIADPRAAVESELGFALPEGLRISVIEEGADHIAIVLPVAKSGLAPEAIRAITGASPPPKRVVSDVRDG